MENLRNTPPTHPSCASAAVRVFHYSKFSESSSTSWDYCTFLTCSIIIEAELSPRSPHLRVVLTASSSSRGSLRTRHPLAPTLCVFSIAPTSPNLPESPESLLHCNTVYIHDFIAAVIAAMSRRKLTKYQGSPVCAMTIRIDSRVGLDTLSL